MVFHSKTNKYKTIGYSEIQSSTPYRDIEFYKAIFGWKFIKEEFVPIEFYRIETNSINGGLLKRPGNLPPTESGTNAFVCSIQVDNFDKICHPAPLLARVFYRPGQQYIWNF